MENEKRITPSKFAPEERRPLIQEGFYIATITKWEVQVIYGKPKILIQMNVSVDENHIPLTYFAPVDLDQDGVIKKPKTTKKIARTLKKVWKGKLFSDIDLDDLIDLQCRTKVKTSIVDYEKQIKPIEEQYSIIQDFDLEITEESIDDVPF